MTNVLYQKYHQVPGPSDHDLGTRSFGYPGKSLLTKATNTHTSYIIWHYCEHLLVVALTTQNRKIIMFYLICIIL